MSRLKTFIGVAVMLAGHGLLGAHLQRTTLWGLRNANPIVRIDPAFEGRIVAISGPLATESQLDDPDYLHPYPMLLLRRVIEEPYEDSDDDLHWRRVGSLGPVHWMQWVAKEANVGGVSFAPTAALFTDVPLLRLDEEAVRHAAPASVARAEWDRELGGFYMSLDVVRGLIAGVPRASGPLKVTGLLKFEGIRRGDEVTVVGRQERGALVPFRYGQGPEEAIVVAQGERTPSEIATWQERATDEAFFTVAYSALAMAGLTLVFLDPLNVGMWFLFCGAGHFFGFFAESGFASALPHLALTVAAFASILVTVVIAPILTDSPVASIVSLAVFGAVVFLFRSRISEEAIRQMEDF